MTAPMDETSKRFTPLTLSPKLCMARVWAGGFGGQCPRLPDKHGLCKIHAKAPLSHGRVDGPVPAEKLQEFLQAESRRKAEDGAALPNATTTKPATVPVPKTKAKSAPSKPNGKGASVVAAQAAAAALRGQVSFLDSKAETATKATKGTPKKATETPKASRAQGINYDLCMARTWGDGHGAQCVKQPQHKGGFCIGHERDAEKNDGVPSHGRIDGPIPAKKLVEFQKIAEKNGWPAPTSPGVPSAPASGIKRPATPATSTPVAKKPTAPPKAAVASPSKRSTPAVVEKETPKPKTAEAKTTAKAKAQPKAQPKVKAKAKASAKVKAAAMKAKAKAKSKARAKARK